ncbi:MAG: dTDP-4-dehydrorhamnose reductase, partial [Chloroflexi bacterium RBG_16_57_11]
MNVILLLGNRGQLGWELHRACLPLGRVIAMDSPETDITDRQNMLRLVQEYRPTVVLNATAYTAVDRAESEPERALAVNGCAPGHLAEAAASVNAALVHISTDYVFDGAKGSPYVETDTPNPLGVYGQSKLAGERAIVEADGAYLIFRTSWLYSLRRESFVTKVLGWARQQTSLRVVTDQVGNPTWARPLAEAICQILAMNGRNLHSWILERKGIYHLAGDGFASRLEWAQAILDNDPQPQEQIIREILPALTAEFPTPAQRPLFSALDCSRFTGTFGLRLPPWGEALRLALDS